MPHRTSDDEPAERPPLQRLDKTELARVVPQLAPEALHGQIRRAGLENCLDLVEAASDEQLTAIFDLDLWAASEAGSDEQFDADRFGEWIESLVERDAATAARVVARLDRSLVVTGLSRHVRVIDPGVLEPTAPSDDEPWESGLFAPTGLKAEIGGYIVHARRTEAWDAVVSLLIELSAGRPDCFHAVMRGCRRLSNAGREQDGLDDLLDAPEQLLHDVALERGDRRVERGFVTPADARAYLALARRPGSPARGETPIVMATRRLLPAPARGVTDARYPDRRETAGLPSLMEYLRDEHPDRCFTRERELALLANTLVAGCRLQSQAFTPEQAAQAVMATCSLGLLRQPIPPGIDYLVGRSLVAIFEDGWAALHREVSLFVAAGLLAILQDVADERSDILEDLHALRQALDRHLSAGTPWLAREALDVLQALDTPTWYGLLGLLSECPIIPEAVTAIVERRTGRIDPNAFAFIATTAQIDTVRAFMVRLPQLLAGLP
jgi:uncharacterized protein DUF6178